MFTFFKNRTWQANISLVVAVIPWYFVFPCQLAAGAVMINIMAVSTLFVLPEIDLYWKSDDQK